MNLVSVTATFLKKVSGKFQISMHPLYWMTPSCYVTIEKNKVEQAARDLCNYSQKPDASCRTNNKVSDLVDIQIIIPAYNVEKYIEQCIDSIVMPSKKITYLLSVINDGSTDSTGRVLEKYKDIYEVEIITQENRGFSGARNSGLKNIRGRYVTFVDSDDWINWETLEKMVIKADEQNADMVEGGFCVVEENGQIRSFVESNPNNYTGYPWGKIYRNYLFEKIHFPEGYWYEDTIISQIVLFKTKRTASCEGTIYYYRQHDKSISHTSKYRPKCIDSLWVCLDLHNDRMEYGIPISQDYYEFILRHIHLTYSRVSNFDNNVSKNIFILFCDFLDREFPGFSTNDEKMKTFEKHLREKNYGKWKAFCDWIRI